MKIYFKSGNCIVLHIEKDIINFFLFKNKENYTFLAKYQNIKVGFDLRDIPILYYYFLIIVLFSGLEEIIDFPEGLENKTTGEMPLVSYSGGVDSTALLHYIQGTPVHITRQFNIDYENRQIKAVRDAGSIEILTDVELIRKLYDTKHGFSCGVGYISMYMPLLYIFNTNYIVLGTIYEGAAFNYNLPFSYTSNLENTRLQKIRRFFKSYNIIIDLPFAGASEVITNQIVKKSIIKNYSSCHTLGNEQFCGLCYKCFRKFGVEGKQIEITEQLKKKLLIKPLPAAVSAVYAIQKAKYEGEMFDKFKNIDVSFAERIDANINNQLNYKEYKYDFDFMNKNDYQNVLNFVNFINNN